MVALVSQAEAVAQLRLVEAALTPAQLADVMFKADQASAIVVDYLKRPFIESPAVNPLTSRPVVNPLIADGLEPSVPPIPPEPWTPASTPVLAKAAILVILTSLYDGRTPDDGLLTPAITSILERLRDPALA